MLLGVELKTASRDTAEGTLVLPFGLAVDKPVALQIDDTGGALSLRFRTCVPVGCLVSLSLDPSLVGALRNGTVWNVKATADGGNETAFKISLRGFSSAIDRTAALTRP